MRGGHRTLKKDHLERLRSLQIFLKDGMDGRWPIFFVPQIDDSFRLDFDPTGLDIGESFPVEYCNFNGQAFFKSHGEPLFSSHMLDLSEVWSGGKTDF